MIEIEKLSPDPHGQAAFMLCESLMIFLIEKGFLSKEESSIIINIITDLKEDLMGETESVKIGVESIRLLKELANSLSAVNSPVFSLEHCDGVGSCVAFRLSAEARK